MIIDRLIIKGYKRFENFEIEFNEKFSVIIGDNESGKSTILEAIDIVMNQRIFNFTDSNFEQYFNNTSIKKFQQNPKFENLPKIEIEIFFKEKEKNINNSYFSGHNSSLKNKLKSGIVFNYQYDKDFREEFESFNFEEGNVFIPTDFYTASWNAFSGNSYHRRKSPIKMIVIDGTKRRNNIFNSYSKQVFNNKISSERKNKLSHSLKENLNNFIKDNEDELKTGNYTFGVDDEKTYIEQIIDLKADGVSLQHKGKGMESLIKNSIALENESDLILIEEPENHLSHMNTRKLIEKIRKSDETSQVIMTTHSPLVVSRMNLTNTLWIRDNKAKSLKDIPKESENFFRRTDNMDVLSFILSNKAILVEGNSEYILLPTLIENTFETTVDDFKNNIFSAGGLTAKYFIEVSKIIGNQLLVITDNDRNEERIKKINDQNKVLEEDDHKIKSVCDDNIENFTFEVCLYNENKAIIENEFQVSSRIEAEYRGEKLPQKLAYMLKNKTYSAMILAEEFNELKKLKLPLYIKDGITWLNQN